MLVLTRRAGESIVIGDEVRVIVLDVRGDTVRLGIEAPRNVQVHRAEVYAEVQAANAAAVSHTGDLESLAGRLARIARPARPGRPGRGAAARSGSRATGAGGATGATGAGGATGATGAAAGRGGDAAPGPLTSDPAASVLPTSHPAATNPRASDPLASEHTASHPGASDPGESSVQPSESSPGIPEPGSGTRPVPRPPLQRPHEGSERG